MADNGRSAGNRGGHRWHFFRAGEVEQVAIRDGKDVAHLPELDPKLWAALAMPTRGVELDNRTLDLLDTDKDGRVRVPEIIAAIKLLDAGLADLGAVMAETDVLAVDEIKDAKLAGAARRALEEIGRKDQKTIALTDISEHGDIVAKLKVNGDGVLPPESADDEATAKVIREIIDTTGGVTDRGGSTGVNQAIVDRFFAEAAAYADWYQKGEADKALWPLGDATPAASAAVAAVRAKIEDYFTRCRLAAYDVRTQASLGASEADLAALAQTPLAATAPEVARLPLARVEAGRPLPLKDGLNPAWNGPMGAFVTTAVVPLVGTRGQLVESDWAAIQGKLAAHDDWATTKPTTPCEALGIARLREIIASGASSEVSTLIARDAAQEALNQEVADVERLLRYKRDLREILDNVVNFSRFYRQKGAVFQAGTLYLDARSCDLCIEVADSAKHAALAAMADSYLAYCDITRTGEKKSIVAAFTGGDSDSLFVGRNGIFYDRKGQDWDATITKVVANPISVRQAFWAPYKKLSRLIEGQVQKRAQAAESESHAHLERAATAVTSADKEPGVAPAEKAPPPAPAKKIDVGTVAAIGVAIGGIGAMVVGVLSAFFGLGAWMPIGIVALVLLISGPSMLLAFVKLRRRNFGPLLDANGWAINGRARINVPFGGALTRIAVVPRHAERSYDDPFAEKKRPWRLYLVIAIVVVLAVSWYVGKLDRFLPQVLRSTAVLGASAPAYTPLPSPTAAAPPAAAAKPDPKK